MKITKIDWQEPEFIAASIYYNNDFQDFVFLHSSRNDKFDNGVRSLIAFDVVDEIVGDNFDILRSKITEDGKEFENCWFGYLSYDLKNSLEKVYEEPESYIKSPGLIFKKFANIIEFNHQTQEVNWYHNSDALPKLTEAAEKGYNVNISDFQSNMSDAEYLRHVERVLEHIVDGDFYEANFTRKFFGEIEVDDKFAMYLALAKKSPAQYGAFIKFGDLYMISSSPESFLKSDTEGNVIAQPIKGTIGIKSADGEAEKLELMNSEKDKAENLMIVDLMRNDLSISCEVGSVKVDKIFEITSYPHLHHLSSVIEAKKRPDVSNVDLIARCFPPGSMTGAPKIKMMEETAKLEKFKRGIYSGAIGYFAGDGSFNFSVVIRTILIQENKFEFQVGGAIVYDSVPGSELEEANVKAQKIKEILGIDNLSRFNDNKSNINEIA